MPQAGRLLAVKILVVEDEDAMARSLARGLQAEGYSVEVAADGHEALRLFHRLHHVRVARPHRRHRRSAHRAAN